MMQKAKYILTFIMALALVAMSISPAQAAGPSGGWRSGISCQNLEGGQATVTLTFYREGQSTEAIKYEDTIDPNGSKNWLTTSSISMKGFPTNFIGAAVISSSTQLACNLNTESTNSGTKASPYRMGTASSFNDAQTGPVMFIPQVVKGPVGYQSYIAVQNTSTSDVTVNIRYFNSDGSEVNAAESGTVKGSSTRVFYTNENTKLPTGFNGGARVEAADGSTKLAVLVAFYKDGTTYGKAMFQSYNGVKTGAAKLFVPRFLRNFQGNQSGLTIQNVGSVATPVTVVFNFGGNSFTVESTNYLPGGLLQPNASWLLYAPSPSLVELAPVDALPESARQGSAVVTAGVGTAKLAASINEDNNVSGNSRYGQGATYNAIADGQQTGTVFFPQFTKSAVNNTFWSGIQVSNTTGTEGTCSIDYVGYTAANETNVPLPAFGSINRWAKSRSPEQAAMQQLPNNYNAAVKVTCKDGSNNPIGITGIVNMSAYGTKYGDSFEQTTGLNQ